MYGVSILICCYNSEKIIEQTLAFVQKQETNNIPWEVILIDNNSTDSTSKIANQSWDYEKNTNFRIVSEKDPGLSNARLKGIKESKYEIVSFVDDDNFIPKNWVKYQYSKFQDPNIGVLGCTSVGKFNFEVPNWYDKHKLAFATGKIHEMAFGEITQDGLVYGAGMTMRKEIFRAFEERKWKPFLTDRIGTKQSGGGDSELTLAARLLGFKIYYSNEINTQHFITSDRLTWDRLKAVTLGFGEADVFTLPYNYHFKKANNTNSLIDFLRTKWWFNYFGKRVSLLRKNIEHSFGLISKEDFEIFEIRNNSFCSTILQNRKTFNQSFKEVQKLLG
jgi:glycosyltransferase involved in cell wall biosynthesis